MEDKVAIRWWKLLDKRINGDIKKQMERENSMAEGAFPTMQEGNPNIRFALNGRQWTIIILQPFY